MRILFLWNTAGVFSPVAKWLNGNGHEAKVCTRTDFDPYEQTSALDCAVMVDGGATDFYKTGLRLIRSFKPDIIHVSGSLKMLILARALAWRTPIVMTFHGTDVRNPSGETLPTAKLADFIHVTTPDMKPYGVWIDRPIDPMFYDHETRETKTALMFYSDHFYKDKRQEARDWCAARGITLTVLDKSVPDFKPIPNHEMPEFLSKFEYLLDWKDQKGELQALSKIALEALSCGCIVIHDSDPTYPIFPESVQIESVEKYFRLYESLPRATWSKALKRLPRVGWEFLRMLLGRVKRGTEM